jgi:hypothetical protein
MDIFRIITASIVVLLVPGAWAIWITPLGEDPIEQLAHIIGTSIVSIALCALFFFYLNIQINAFWLILSLGILLLVFGIGYIRSRSFTKPILLTLIALLFISLLVFWRLYQARMLVLPAWVDSPHHTLIVKKILETGGLPQDLSPYIQIPFNYHFAFHVSAALFSILSGLPPEQAILIFGQILNAAICLSIYCLAKAIWHDWRRALIAALLVGFFSQMPAFYLSWGRYTLLTGLILLPLALARIIEINAKRDSRALLVFHLALYTAGIFLSHYFVGFLLTLFILSISMEWVVARIRSSSLHSDTMKLVLAGFGAGLLLSAPWLYRVICCSNGLLNLKDLLAGENLLSGGWATNLTYLWQLAGPERGYLLLILALFGTFLSIQSKQARPLFIWSILLGLGCIPHPFRPGFFRPDHFIIVIFLPATIYASNFLAHLADALKKYHKFKWFSSLFLCLLVGVLCAWGIYETRHIVNPRTILSSREDIQAIDWINENTPEDARFFINTTYWQEGLYRGVDGGIWILPLTGRSTIIPPITYALGDDEFRERINQLAEKASRITGCSSDLWELIESEGITYIYIKMGVGSLQPDGLRMCEAAIHQGYWLNEVYHSGYIHIYQIMARPPSATRRVVIARAEATQQSPFYAETATQERAALAVKTAQNSPDRCKCLAELR